MLNRVEREQLIERYREPANGLALFVRYAACGAYILFLLLLTVFGATPDDDGQSNGAGSARSIGAASKASATSAEAQRKQGMKSASVSPAPGSAAAQTASTVQPAARKQAKPGRNEISH